MDYCRSRNLAFEFLGNLWRFCALRAGQRAQVKPTQNPKHEVNWIYSKPKKREDESSLIATIILQQKLYSQLSLVCLRVSRSPHQSPHERLLGIQRVSNPSTENQRISTPAHSNGCKADSNLVWSYWYKSNKRVFMGSKTRIQEASWVQSFVERVLCVCVCVIHITCFNQSCHRCACVKYTRHD